MFCTPHFFKAPDPSWVDLTASAFADEAVHATLPHMIHWYHRVKTFRVYGEIAGVPFDATTSAPAAPNEPYIPRVGVEHSVDNILGAGSYEFRMFPNKDAFHLATDSPLGLTRSFATWSPRLFARATMGSSETFSSKSTTFDINPLFTTTLQGHDAVADLDYAFDIEMRGDALAGSMTIEPLQYWTYDGIYDEDTGARL